MLALKKVAVTGSLSSGKSSVCRFFRELGAYVISADELVHKLLLPTTDLGKSIINLLGCDVVVNEQFDRSKISKKVFNNTHLLKSLEDILHPAVFAEIEAQYKQVNDEGKTPLFVAEIPLLFETGSNENYDATIVVFASPQRCLKRFMASEGRSEQEFNNRMKHQMPPEEKVEKGDFVLINNGSSEELKTAVRELFNKLTQ